MTDMVTTSPTDVQRLAGSKLSGWAVTRLVLFYGGFIALLLLIITKHLGWLPHHFHLAKRISDNSEGYVLALIGCAWIHWARPAAIRRRQLIPISLVGAVVCFGLALLCKFGGLQPKIATLNEGFFGAAFVLAYVALRRPLRWAPLFSLVAVIALLLANNASVVVKGAEAWMVLVLAPLSFDVFDRAILEPDARESQALRLLWMALLVAVPVLAAGLHHHLGHGHVAGIQDYISRANEAFVGMFIIHAYFGYWMRPALATHGPRTTN
jgi:hypothetical protein